MADAYGGITMDEALRAAINVLRDSAESRRMPSGEPLDATAARRCMSIQPHCWNRCCR